MVVSEGLWKVTGGVGKGGLIVRTEKNLLSQQEHERLETGAVVRALEHDNTTGRLRYELVSGFGPDNGWVTTQVQGKPLLAEVQGKPLLAEVQEQLPRPTPAATEGLTAPQNLLPSAAANGGNKQALRWYSQNFKRTADGAREAAAEAWEEHGAGRPAAAPHGGHQHANGTAWSDAEWAEWLASQQAEAWQQGGWCAASAEPWRQVEDVPIAPAAFRRELGTKTQQKKGVAVQPLIQLLANRTSLPDASSEKKKKQVARNLLGYDGLKDKLVPAETFSIKRDCPNEDEEVCPKCRLPLGEVGYSAFGPTGNYMHAECKAQALIRGVCEEDRQRLQREFAAKQAKREEFGIGWRAAAAPRGAELAAKLGCELKGQELCCVVLNDADKSVSLAPTHDPVAAVNLEYLSLALQVRRREGREPLFSLDPSDRPKEGADLSASQRKSGWQVKRFEPPWLAGTSVGEVMFQADYHLKELSMGECGQPVIGMKSCFDYSEAEGFGQEWSAREWFVVRRAEVQLTQDCVLVPRVRMGVEAREQIQGADGLEDAPLTRPDHPLVRYAADFSKNFELIAERRSVIHHLRELAKASVLAKYLVDAGVAVDESWFYAVPVSSEGSRKEIPQLWNERQHSSIDVLDGRIKGWDSGIRSRMHGVYGGVQMGLDRFPLQEVVVAPTRISRADMPQQRGPQFLPSRAFVRGMAKGMPQGVDLNLDGFNLSAPTQALAQSGLAAAFEPGKAFFRALDGAGLPAAAVPLLREVFCPGLTDRREEEESFVPPENNPAYLDHLHKLLQVEKEVSEARQELFRSPAFMAEDAGSLFPSSWTPAVRSQKTQASLRSLPPGCAPPRPERLLRVTAPMLDQLTEDGQRFRVYRAGSLEVRTVQRPGGEETLVAIFSVTAPHRGGLAAAAAGDLDKVAKVTELVEADERDSAQVAGQGRARPHRFFMKVETQAGAAALVEQRATGGAIAWAEATPDLEERCSLAKVTRSVHCRGADLTMADIKRFYSEASQRSAACWSDYSRDFFERVRAECPTSEEEEEAEEESQ